MNRHPNIDCLFLKGDPNVENPYIQGDTFFANCEDSLIPGVFIKTVIAFHCFKDKYDYYFRTNLSSFIVLDKMYKLCENSPRERFCRALTGNHGQIKYPSGCGFLISNDVLNSIIQVPRILNLARAD